MKSRNIRRAAQTNLVTPGGSATRSPAQNRQPTPPLLARGCTGKKQLLDRRYQ